jgi:hypothetical protein
VLGVVVVLDGAHVHLVDSLRVFGASVGLEIVDVDCGAKLVKFWEMVGG